MGHCAHEWGQPLVCLSIDMHAAFDSLLPRHVATQLKELGAAATQEAPILREMVGARVQPAMGPKNWDQAIWVGAKHGVVGAGHGLRVGHGVGQAIGPGRPMGSEEATGSAQAIESENAVGLWRRRPWGRIRP